MRSDYVVMILCMFAAIGCTRKDSAQQAVARIDDRTLTVEDVRARLDTSRGVTAAQVAEYARRWITDEILFREAVRRGLDRKPEIVARLDEVQRQLTINALLQQEIYSDTLQRSTPDEISQYYNAHSKEFTLSTDVALVSYVLFRDRDGANSFRALVLRGVPWAQAIDQTLRDPQLVLQLVGRVDSTYSTQSTLLPPELWRVASASARQEPSFPIRTNDGSYILFVWKLLRQGQVADQAYVEQEIRSRLAIERRRRAFKTLVETLRSKHAVEFLLSIDVDTSASNFVR